MNNDQKKKFMLPVLYNKLHGQSKQNVILTNIARKLELSDDNNTKHKIIISIVGHKGAGKTSIIRKYTQNIFIEK